MSWYYRRNILGVAIVLIVCVYVMCHIQLVYNRIQKQSRIAVYHQMISDINEQMSAVEKRIFENANWQKSDIEHPNGTER